MTGLATRSSGGANPTVVQRRVAACVVVFDARNRLLLHKRTDNGQWSLPGGVIEPHETASAAAVREVEEETGYEVEVTRLVGVYSDPAATTMRYPDGNTVAWVAIVFEARLLGGAARVCEESSAVEWFALDALPAGFNPNHLPRLSDALSRQAAAVFR